MQCLNSRHFFDCWLRVSYTRAMPPRRSARERQRFKKKQAKLLQEQMAKAANDVLSHGIVEHDDDIEVTQTSQARCAEQSVTSRQPGSIEQVKNIPVTKARDWEANVRMNQAEYLRQVSLQSPSQPGELRHATSSQQSRLKPAQTLARRYPSPTAMAGQISMTPEEFRMLVKERALKMLAKIGASDETISKAADDDWAFSEEEEELAPNTNAGSTGSSASEKPAAPETMTKATQSTTTTQENAEDPKVQKIQVKLAELRKKLNEKKTEVFEPTFEDASSEIEIQLPANVKSLDEWSTAVVRRGKFKGKSYKAAFDDDNYRKWLMDNFGSLKSPAIVDLAKYVICQTKAVMAKATA